MATYAIDFDNTLAYTNFPEILAPNKKMIAYVKMIQAQGHKTILWTSRMGEELQRAVEWCERQGIEFDSINEALPEMLEHYQNDTRKIFADYYIDDKAITVEMAESTIDFIEQVINEMQS